MQSGNPLLRVLERMGCGAVFVDGTGHILSFNQTAVQVIGDLANTKIVEDDDLREGFKKLIYISGNRFKIDSESWIVISRNARKALAVYAMPMGEGNDAYDRSLIIMVDLETKFGPSHDVLKKIFKLTPSESVTALQLLEGNTPSEIADNRGISPWTVRTQLASIFDKTNTRRQPDLISLLMRISLLP